jgi:hypothetical protein
MKYVGPRLSLYGNKAGETFYSNKICWSTQGSHSITKTKPGFSTRRPLTPIGIADSYAIKDGEQNQTPERILDCTTT